MTNNKKKYTALALGAIIATTGVVGVASADEHKRGENDHEGRGGFMRDLRQERKEFRGKMNGEREHLREGRRRAIEMRNKVKAERRDIGTMLRDGFKKERTEQRDTFKKERGAYREDFKAKMQAATTDEERKIIRVEARDTRKELRDNVQGTRADFRAKAHNEREVFRNKNKELRNNFKAGVRDRLKKRLEHINSRLDGAYARFGKLTERIQNYITKKKEAGADVDAAQTALDATSIAKEAVKVQVSKTKELIRTILASDTPRKQMKELRASIKESVRAIKAVNKAMKEAIRAARAIK